MAKKKKKDFDVKVQVENHHEIEEAKADQITKVKIQAVDLLENASKVGFYAEKRHDDDSMLEPLVRLCCESKDGESDPTILTPWCTVNTLTTLVQGCLYLNPLIIHTIKNRQANAPRPEDQPEKPAD